MSTARTGRPSEPHWHNLYKAAILEIDTAKLRGRVEEAKQAIHARMEELALSDQNGEWETLSDALNVLEDLLKMNQPFHREPHHGED